MRTALYGRPKRSRRFDFRCPAGGCEYGGETFEQLKGHVDGKRPWCELHDTLPPLKKWEFIE